MSHEVHVLETPEAAAAAAAEHLAAAMSAASPDDVVTVALSGGTTPDRMFAVLAGLRVPWDGVALYQVDERVAPDDDPARNATHLLAALGAEVRRYHGMDVTNADLAAAAAAYDAALPEHLDVVHLGLGADGHTASLTPGDPVCDVVDRRVAVTAPYQGHRRMTLTFPALDAAREVVWLVAGAEKREALARLLEADPAIPAGRVRVGRSTVFCDRAAR